MSFQSAFCIGAERPTSTAQLPGLNLATVQSCFDVPEHRPADLQGVSVIVPDLQGFLARALTNGSGRMHGDWWRLPPFRALSR
jgi:hypothetical protein